jgi:uncharacterized membrane protein YcaP (DUF421 family)
MFMPQTPLLEIFVRGSVMYLAIFTLLRVILKRQSGALGTSDLLLIVLIADAAQNGMADDYKSITDGLLLVATLIFWNFFLDWLSYRVPAFHRLIQPAPIAIVRDGKILIRNLRKELLTEEELREQLREHGIDHVSAVKLAMLESDGRLSVIEKKQKANDTPERKQS